jgi:hypothetical protein
VKKWQGMSSSHYPFLEDMKDNIWMLYHLWIRDHNGNMSLGAVSQRNTTVWSQRTYMRETPNNAANIVESDKRTVLNVRCHFLPHQTLDNKLEWNFD